MGGFHVLKKAVREPALGGLFERSPFLVKYASLSYITYILVGPSKQKILSVTPPKLPYHKPYPKPHGA